VLKFKYPNSAKIERAIEVVMAKLKEQWYVLEEPEPVVFAKAFASDDVVLEVRAWTPGFTWFTLYSNLPRLVKEALDESGIQIPYPQRVVWFATPLRRRRALRSVLRTSRSPMLASAMLYVFFVILKQ